MVAITAATLLVYVDALGNAFLWDDLVLIVDNPAIKHWAGIPRLFRSTLFPEEILRVYYRPLQTLTYVFDYQLWGLRPPGFHLTNTLLHAGSAVLLYRLGTVVLRDARAALVGALLFAVHPIHTEAVTYVSGRSDPLAAVLMLASALWFLEGGWKLVLSLGAFFLALLAREAALILPLLLVVIDGTVSPARLRRWWRYLPYAGVLALYAVVRSAVAGATPAVTPAVPLGLRLLTMAKVIVEYLGLLVLPVNLHMERLVPPAASALEPSIVGSVVLLGSLVAAVVLCRNRMRPVTFGTAWFLVALLPVANVVPLSTFMAEHWLYVPSMGYFLAVGGLVRLANGTWRRVLATVVAAALAVYGGLTIRRNLDWKDGLTLYQSMLPLAPQSARLYGSLGQAYQQAGQIEKAKAAYAHLMTLGPSDFERATTLNNLGKIYRDEERYGDSLAALDRALVLNPRFVGAHDNRAVTLLAMGRVGEAERTLQHALGLDPNAATTHNNLGSVHFVRGDLARARAEFLEAIRLNPEYARAYSNLGSTYFWSGQPELAEDAYRHALRIDPGLEEASRYLEMVRQSRTAAPSP